jgi:D-hydroxyproline dehydrogenase subunit beta
VRPARDRPRAGGARAGARGDAPHPRRGRGGRRRRAPHRRRAPPPRKGQLTRLRLPSPDPSFLRRKVVDASYLLAVGAPDAGRQVATVVETTWDGHVVVGSTRERIGFDDRVDHDLAREVQALAARLVPGVAGLQPDDTWVGFRPWLPDGLPAIGALRDGVWAATGHEGAGVVLGPITGRLLAQAICGERPEVDLAPFDPGRFDR